MKALPRFLIAVASWFIALLLIVPMLIVDCVISIERWRKQKLDPS